MPSVGNIQQIVAVIRQQLVARGGPARAQPGQPATRPPTDLFAHIGQRVRTIDRDDPDRGRKAFRVFLETVLLGELGANLVNDPGFHQVVDDVQRQLEADPQTAASVEAAIDHLLAAAP